MGIYVKYKRSDTECLSVPITITVFTSTMQSWKTYVKKTHGRVLLIRRCSASQLGAPAPNYVTRCVVLLDQSHPSKTRTYNIMRHARGHASWFVQYQYWSKTEFQRCSTCSSVFLRLGGRDLCAARIQVQVPCTIAGNQFTYVGAWYWYTDNILLSI